MASEYYGLPTRGDGSAEGPPLDMPFDIGLTPDALLAEDSPEQSLTMESALRIPEGDQDNGAGFFMEAVRSISLGTLEKWKKENHRVGAVRNLLRGRSNITIEGRHTVDSRNGDLFWEMNAHFLDLVVCVGRRGMGLGPIMKNVEADHTSVFQLDFSRMSRRFTAKNVKLGFDPDGCIVWIGISPLREDVWLAFVPKEGGGGDEFETTGRGGKQGGAPPSEAQQRRVFMFLAKILAGMKHRQCIVSEDYPDVTNKREFHFATNILKAENKFDLNFEELRRFDEKLRGDYDRWLEEAPESWRDDNIFSERTPLCITTRYGQDQRIGVSVPGESENWDRERRWDTIRFLNVAVASHLRVRKVDGYEDIDIEDILDDYDGNIYTSADQTDPDRRKLTREDLEALDQMDSEGRAIPVFDGRGYYVQRQRARFGREKPHGLLSKSKGLERLFEPDFGFPPYQDREKNFTFYPQAGLRTVGHFQAEGLPTKCYPLISDIDRNVRGVGDVGILGDEHDDDSEFHEDAGSGPKAIHGISCQGYNVIMHRVRGRGAQHHDAQVGLVTAALGGAWAVPGSSGSHAAAGYFSQCKNKMPHVSFEEKIGDGDLNDDRNKTDFRLENLFYIDMDALPTRAWRGGIIFQDIVIPLSNIWSHPSLFLSLKDMMQVFTYQAFPALYTWTTYPLTSLLELIFEQAAQHSEGKKFEQVFLVELCSVIERALNYMHTGNAAVIATSVMNPLWIGRAIIKDGSPCLNANMVRLYNNSVHVSPSSWPRDKNGEPFSSSRRSQLFNYGNPHFRNFYAHLSIATVMGSPPSSSKLSENRFEKVAAVAGHVLKIFVQDCRELVTNGVKKEIRHQSELPSTASHAHARGKALENWRKSNNPLSRSKGDSLPVRNLLIALSGSPDEINQDVLTGEVLAPEQLSQIMLDAVQSSSKSIHAPVTKDGFFLPTLRIAISEMKKMLVGTAESNSEGFFCALLAFAILKTKIDFVPWHKPPAQPGLGCPPRVASYKHWALVDSSRSRSKLLQGLSEGVPPEVRATTAAGNSSRSNTSAPWKVSSNLGEMGPLWSKATFPEQWSLKNASLNGDKNNDYVIKTYQWCANFYDGTIWKHHMALTWAILFTQILPDVDTDLILKGSLGKDAELEVNAAILKLPWRVPKQKGTKAKEPYITMLSTSILALLEDNSPLRNYMRENNNAFGRAWSDKHNPKRINALLFVRLGLATALSPSFISRPLFGKNWEVKSDSELQRLYKNVMGHLDDRKYGVYLALREIGGEIMANHVARKGKVLVPYTGTPTST